MHPGSTLTPEQEKLVLLQSIFLPHTRRLRDEAYARLSDTGPQTGETHLRCAHYTAAETALEIIRSKRIWLRNSTCMADYREVQHGFDIYQRIFDEKFTNDFRQALDICADGAASEAIHLFNSWWLSILSHTYLASMSEHHSREDAHGRLSMWRAFGGSSARVAIVLKIPRISQGAAALGLTFAPVAYLQEGQIREQLLQVVGNIQSNHEFLRSLSRPAIVTAVFSMLLVGITCLKHEGFAEEQEWRAIYSPDLESSSLVESAIEAVGGVPQIVHKVPLDVSASAALADLDFAKLFDRLIVGPSQYPLALKEAFTFELTKAGIPNASDKVVTSLIPIRA